MNNRYLKDAKKLLVHYFEVLFEKQGVRFDSDNRAEIEDIVDNIVWGILEELREQERERQAND